MNPITIDMQAETAERDRIWALDERALERELRRIGLDPLTLDRGLGAAEGSPLAAADTADAADAAGECLVEIAGPVKFFDPIKGFGFVDADDGEGDVLLLASCLQAAGCETAHAGARVHAWARRGPKGRLAVRIVGIDDSSATDPALLPQRTHRKVEAESGWEQMTVRWFNTRRGYGFVSRGAGAPDVFVHSDTLRRWGLASLRPHQVVEVRWGRVDTGCMVAQIRHPRLH
jgi:CspA family cold shock protein